MQTSNRIGSSGPTGRPGLLLFNKIFCIDELEDGLSRSAIFTSKGNPCG